MKGLLTPTKKGQDERFSGILIIDTLNAVNYHSYT